jgi:outer membrane lipoprotein SlyB
MKKILPIIAIGFLLSACSATTGAITKKDVTTLGGCVAGGVAGSQVGSGSGKKWAIITGTVLGCHGGSILGKKIDSDN